MSRRRRFFSRTSNIVGLSIVLFFAALAVFAPWLQPPPDPDDPLPFKVTGQSFYRTPGPPSAESPLGTAPQIENLPQYGIRPDQDAAFQWDVLYTLVWGARSAFRFGLGVTLTTAAIGLVVGLVSGYVGGTFGNVTMRVTDAFLAFPVIAAVWVIQQAFYSTIYSPFVLREEWSQFDHWLYESRIDPIFVALILFSWMPYARIMHTLTAQARRTEYVQAAEAMGARTPRLLFYHILPNIVAPAVVMAARDIGAMVLLASAFIFIGFGGNVAWGTILVGSRDYVVGVAGNPFQYWWTFVPISLAIVLFGAGWNLLGDGLNDYLNPHRR